MFQLSFYYPFWTAFDQLGFEKLTSLPLRFLLEITKVHSKAFFC